MLILSGLGTNARSCVPKACLHLEEDFSIVPPPPQEQVGSVRWLQGYRRLGKLFWAGCFHLIGRESEDEKSFCVSPQMTLRDTSGGSSQVCRTFAQRRCQFGLFSVGAFPRGTPNCLLTVSADSSLLGLSLGSALPQKEACGPPHSMPAPHVVPNSCEVTVQFLRQ